MSSQIVSFKCRHSIVPAAEQPLRVPLSHVERIVLTGYVDVFRVLLEEDSFSSLELLAGDFAGWCSVHGETELEQVAAALKAAARSRCVEESLNHVERLARLAHMGLVVAFPG